MTVTVDHHPDILGSRRALRAMVLVCLGLLLLAFVPQQSSAQFVMPIDVITIDGTITKVTDEYVERALDDALDRGAQALLIELDSAGGDKDATSEIVYRIRQSEIPVIVLITPGAHVRGSAVEIVGAAHVSAIAPDATIGDASRVAEGLGVEDADDETQTELTVLAQERERPTDWIIRSTDDNFIVSANQAASAGIVDLMATDRMSLLSMVNTWTIPLANGESVTLETTGSLVNPIEMTTFEEFRAFMTSPSVAYVLLCFGVLGLFLEIASPGGFVAGIIGIICLIGGSYAFSQLPIERNGLLLLLLAFAMLGLDLFVTSFGLLTLGGLAAFIAGSTMLIDTDIVGYDPISRPVIWTAAACVIAFALFIGLTGISSLRSKPVTGPTAMIGAVGVVREALSPRGMIFVQGELWQARASGLTDGAAIPVGAKVEVQDIHGLLLDVAPISATSSSERRVWNEPLRTSVLPVRGGVDDRSTSGR